MVEAAIHHPTDTGLLTDGVRVITRVVTGLKKLVPGIGGGLVKHTRQVKKIYLGLMKVMKGRLGKSRAVTEFGRKVLLGETDHGIISAYDVLEENPADITLLKVDVKGHRRLFRKRLKAVSTDRGFYSKENEGWLRKGGVKRVGIPVRGKIHGARRAYQRQSWFKRRQRFRAGVEAKISLLKRKFGLRRSLLRGSPGVNTWVGQGIFAHNLRQAARIA